MPQLRRCERCLYSAPAAADNGQIVLCHRYPQFAVVPRDYWCGEFILFVPVDVSGNKIEGP